MNSYNTRGLFDGSGWRGLQLGEEMGRQGLRVVDNVEVESSTAREFGGQPASNREDERSWDPWSSRDDDCGYSVKNVPLVSSASDSSPACLRT